jgi:hypothetical protein
MPIRMKITDAGMNDKCEVCGRCEAIVCVNCVIAIAKPTCPWCKTFWKSTPTEGRLECPKCKAIALAGRAMK